MGGVFLILGVPDAAWWCLLLVVVCLVLTYLVSASYRRSLASRSPTKHGEPQRPTRPPGARGSASTRESKVKRAPDENKSPTSSIARPTPGNLPRTQVALLPATMREPQAPPPKQTSDLASPVAALDWTAHLPEHVNALRRSDPNTIPREGDIWTALPDNAFGQLYLRKNSKPQATTQGSVTSGGTYTPLGGEPASVEWLKIRLDDDGSIHRIEPRSASIFSRATLNIAAKRAILIPGFSSPKGPEALRQSVEFNDTKVQSRVGRSEVHYNACFLWSVGARSLLSRRAHLDEGSSGTARPVDRALSLLRQALGLDGASRRVSPRLLARGEFVSVRFDPRRPPTPSLVLSGSAVSEDNCAIVVPILHVARHDADENTVPLESDVCELLKLPANKKKIYVVDLTVLRGIKDARLFVSRREPRVLATLDSMFFESIDRGLHRLYGQQASSGT